MTRPPLAALAALALLVAPPTACARDGAVRVADAGEIAPDVPRDDAAAILAAFPDDRDPAVRAARAALAAGAPWRATLAIAPALADPARRTTTAALIAAAAAAERDDDAAVARILGPTPLAGDAGFGALLRARAALATAPRAAYAEAMRAAEQAPDARERGVRLAVAARALDRALAAGPAAGAAAAPLADSARRAYEAAARLLPRAADWLTLRAAAVTRDAEQRARLLATVQAPLARDRAALADAEARERAADSAGAAAAYAALGARARALSLRLATGADRAAIRDSAVALVDARSGTAEARAAVELLDRAFAPLTPREELAVARSSAASGPAARAVDAYRRALAAGVGTTRDRYAYGGLLVRIGRARDGARELGVVRAAGGALAGPASYERARALLRAGDGAAARAALRETARDFAGDAATVASARTLLADLLVDDGDDAGARALLRAIVREQPRTSRAPRAAFDAAIIALAGGDARAAATELDALRAGLDSTSELRAAATYWAGRAWSSAGNDARARERWRDAATRAAPSYYGMLADRRLGVAVWSPPADAGRGAAPADVDAAAERIALLERIGFDPEAGRERDALIRSADSSAARALGVATALQELGATSAAMRAARRASETGPPSRALYRALYPWPWESYARAAAQARGIDAGLVAAVIRQESNFTPGATSAAGAIGLMQIMPPVGRALWNALGEERAGIAFTPTLLRQPDVSIALGTQHLASSLAQYPHPAFALAAYNAGGTPVARWRRRAGTADPELFVERIPYDETRDYVRIVTRNAAYYQALYESAGR